MDKEKERKTDREKKGEENNNTCVLKHAASVFMYVIGWLL